MSDTQKAHFECESCGKRYTWKPQLAGKKAKCKCGATLTVPQSIDDDDAADAMYDLVDDEKAAPGGGAATTGQRCPECSADLEAGAVLCISCGYNLKLGRKMGTAIGGTETVPPIATPAASVRSSGAMAAAAAAPPGITPPRSQPSTYTYDQSSRKSLILGGLAIVVVAALVTAFLFLRDAPPSQPLLGDDAALIAMMKDDNFIDANELLDKTGRMVAGMTGSKARGYIENLKDMGARQVYAADATMSMSLILELPDDPDQRKKLFDYEHRWHTDMREKPTTDVGQRYMRLKMRL